MDSEVEELGYFMFLISVGMLAGFLAVDDIWQIPIMIGFAGILVLFVEFVKILWRRKNGKPKKDVRRRYRKDNAGAS